MPPKTTPKRQGRRRVSPARKRTGGISLHVTDWEKAKLERAARLDTLEPAPWARSMLLMLADHRIAGLSLQVALHAALENLSKNNPSAYAETMKALARTRAQSKNEK